MTDRMPAEVFPPGEHLADELEERGWSQADFAEIIGRPVQFVSEIVNAKKELTAESAAQIAAALGSDASTWLGLQAKYQLWRLSQDAGHLDTASRVATRAQIASIIPLAQLEKRGIIGANESPGDLLDQVRRDFNMVHRDDSPHFGMAAKRSNDGDDLSLIQRGWLWAAQRQARTQKLPDYDRAGFERLVERLAREVSEPSDLASLPERFAQVGVHLVFVEHFPGGKIDGAAFMLDKNPVVAVSGRGKRFDKLFFAIMHECGHVVAGHVDDGVALDDVADEAALEANKAREDEANSRAEAWSLGGPVRISGVVSAQAVAGKSAELGVPVAFVVGNLQHHGVLPWKSTLARGLANADDVLRGWVSK